MALHAAGVAAAREAGGDCMAHGVGGDRVSCNLLVDRGTAGTCSGYPLHRCPPHQYQQILRLAGTWQEEAISRRSDLPPGFSRRCRSAIWTVLKPNNRLSAGRCRSTTTAVPIRANTQVDITK